MLKHPQLVKIFLSICLTLVISISEVRARPDYGATNISLLTYSPGDELYSSFGHSSLRVKNLGDDTDWVFNYGTFDFDDPKFYLGFMRGNLYYRLSRLPYSYVIDELNTTNRSLIETPLQLSINEKTRLIQFLELNYLPENREYLYDFLYNNCATKLIELIDFATRNRTVYNPMIIPDLTFRQLLDPYFESRPWLDIGVDLILGLPVDRKVMGNEASFLPDNLHLIVKNARIAGTDGKSLNLAGTDILALQQTRNAQKNIIQPSWILWPLALICLISAIFDSYFSPFLRYLYKTVLFCSAILGIIIVLLWLLTSHYILNYNTDLLWANPLLLLLLFFRKNLKSVAKVKLHGILLVILASMAILGAFLSLTVEKNPNLAAIACIILIGLLDRLQTNRKALPSPIFSDS